ncbi:MAG: aspartyl/asparaginyl beta-hydroxylase domain-containing protein [Bacteroidia bacterium]
MNDFSVNNSLLLPIKIDTKKLCEDLQTCLKAQWKEHFNTHDYSGSWTAISLRSQSGNAEDIHAHNSTLPFANTPLLEQCNYFKEIIDSFQCEKETVRLLRLQPGSVIKEHRDLGLAYRFGDFRIHIPILTEAAVTFLVGGKNIPMKKGECWYADFDQLHSVKNDSTSERIHLVIDGKRNEWTDDLFKKAKYDFEAEKRQLQPVYDEETLNNMIICLEKINTDTSRKMINDLLNQKKNLSKNKNSNNLIDLSRGYVPSKVISDANELRFLWTFIGSKKFTEPFFSETLSACKNFSENKFVKKTSAHELIETSATIDAVDPSAFIFHISRCGSTLLTQMLSTSENCIVLSEVPVFDELLRLKFNRPELFNKIFFDGLFKSVLRFYAQRSDKNKTHLFIKCDSWHTLFYEQIRDCYPTVPIILLYRSPLEVVRSQTKIPGMQAVPGLLEPSIFGFDPSETITMQKDLYFGNVLECYLKKYEEILEHDPAAFAVNYHDGPEAMLQCISAHTDFMIDNKTMDAMMKRARYHSKEPSQIFKEEEIKETEPEWLSAASKAFRRIEKNRTDLKKQN